MFILVDRDANPVCGTNGEPFQYSTLQLATIAAKILGKRDGVYYRVDDAR